MTLDELSQYLTWILYILVFAVVVVRAVRDPMRANVDVALLFGLPGLMILISALTKSGLLPTSHITSTLSSAALLGMVYMLVRLAYDFMDVPVWVIRTAEVTLAIILVAAFMVTTSSLLTLAEIVYLLVALSYVSVVFVRASRKAGGVTRRRMIAITVGTLCLFAVLILASLSVAIPELTRDGQAFSELLGLASGLAYFIGFATPTIVRRAWQEPELRAFLQRAATLPRLPSTKAIIAEIENGAAVSVGTARANVALWNEADNTLVYDGDKGGPWEIPVDANMATGKAFVTQAPVFLRQIKPGYPSYARAKEANVTSMLVAPITAGQRRLGVLAVYADRPPIFADEDLELVKLLADQAAVILESRTLMDQAVQVQVQQQSTRLKEDFLSAAAHDLRTPLTILVGQVELMERRIQRNPDAPAELVSVQRLKTETHRLKTLVLELLDAERIGQGSIVTMRSEVDLIEIAEEACQRHSNERHHCSVRAEGPVTGMYDPIRIQQLVENLVENAVKYSPDGGTVEIKLWSEPGGTIHRVGEEGVEAWNHLTVTDHGIGIPAGDLPSIFERFHRGTNVDDRRFVGMGLGLFICKTIAEQHGGRISVESTRINYTNNGTGNTNGIYKDDSESGTTFHIVLPTSTVANLPVDATRAS
ncbi:MAG: ATP-binding protein [Chloroflexota bacterium]